MRHRAHLSMGVGPTGTLCGLESEVTDNSIVCYGSLAVRLRLTGCSLTGNVMFPTWENKGINSFDCYY